MITDNEYENKLLSDPRCDMVALIVKQRILREKENESFKNARSPRRCSLVRRVFENLHRLFYNKNSSYRNVLILPKKHPQKQ